MRMALSDPALYFKARIQAHIAARSFLQLKNGQALAKHENCLSAAIVLDHADLPIKLGGFELAHPSGVEPETF